MFRHLPPDNHRSTLYCLCMPHRTLRKLLLLAAFLFSTAGRASDLVDADWLQNRPRNDLVILDLREPPAYREGHIPGAYNLPLSKLLRRRNGVDNFVETPSRVRDLMRSLGIRDNDTLVLYGDWAFLAAMRAYWTFDFYGHANKKVLDGGIQAWRKTRALERAPPAPRPRSNYVVEIRPEVLATKLRTLMASKSPDHVIVDARQPADYAGKSSLTSRKGHIPGAINLPWFELVQNRSNKDGLAPTGKPAHLANLDTLKAKLRSNPGRQGTHSVLQCRPGVCRGLFRTQGTRPQECALRRLLV